MEKYMDIPKRITRTKVSMRIEPRRTKRSKARVNKW